MSHYFVDFADAIGYAERLMKSQAQDVHTSTWQGTDIGNRPEAAMKEVLDLSLRVSLQGDRRDFNVEIAPNQPWADDHFIERVCGEPLNPGETWRTWPWSNSADKFRDHAGRFDHNYMERYWPRYAGMTQNGKLDKETVEFFPNKGIRHCFGDLNDVLNLLARDPLTRQAYMPIFFPEDTGMRHQGRAPCSLGYHFIIRDQRLSCVYSLRSCDFHRHFRDDLYLTVRLVQWVLGELWVRHRIEYGLGFLTTHITSLHMFINDWRALVDGR